jgi:hypothetical protein
LQQQAKMAPALGIEPSAPPLNINILGGTLSPYSSPDLQLLLRVVEKWPSLSGSLKLAILAIVEGSSER